MEAHGHDALVRDMFDKAGQVRKARKTVNSWRHVPGSRSPFWKMRVR